MRLRIVVKFEIKEYNIKMYQVKKNLTLLEE